MNRQEAFMLVGRLSSYDLELLTAGKHPEEWLRPSSDYLARCREAARIVLDTRQRLVETQHKVAALFRDWSTADLHRLVLGHTPRLTLPEGLSVDEQSRFAEGALIALDIRQGWQPRDITPWSRRHLQERIQQLREEDRRLSQRERDRREWQRSEQERLAEQQREEQRKQERDRVANERAQLEQARLRQERERLWQEHRKVGASPSTEATGQREAARLPQHRSISLSPVETAEIRETRIQRERANAAEMRKMLAQIERDIWDKD